MAIDASLIEADANKQNSTPKENWDTSAIDPTDAPARFANISTRWMRPLLVPPARCSPNSPPILIPQANGQRPVKDPPIRHLDEAPKEG